MKIEFLFWVTLSARLLSLVTRHLSLLVMVYTNVEDDWLSSRIRRDH